MFSEEEKETVSDEESKQPVQGESLTHYHTIPHFNTKDI